MLQLFPCCKYIYIQVWYSEHRSGPASCFSYLFTALFFFLQSVSLFVYCVCIYEILVFWLHGLSHLNISVKDNGSLKLRTDHAYHHQIQGQLHLTGYHCCDLIVWTDHGKREKDIDAPLGNTEVIRITRDTKWTANIETITDFYIRQYIDMVNNA